MTDPTEEAAMPLDRSALDAGTEAVVDGGTITDSDDQWGGAMGSYSPSHGSIGIPSPRCTSYHHGSIGIHQPRCTSYHHGSIGIHQSRCTSYHHGSLGIHSCRSTSYVPGFPFWLLCQALVRVWGLRQWRCHKSSMLPDREKEGF